MGKVIGVGGIFMGSSDPEALKAWYVRVLGLEVNDYGGFDFRHGDSAAAFPEGARTIFAPFDAGSDYFAPSTLDYMINLIVDDLDAILARCVAEGVPEAQPAEAHEYGRFGWIIDPDGRKIELWQPPS